MIREKNKTIILSLQLIKNNEYHWHAYLLKKYLEENFNIKKEVIYPIIRWLQENKYICFKIVNNENNREQKKFIITSSGIDYLVSQISTLESFISSVHSIEDKGINDYE